MMLACMLKAAVQATSTVHRAEIGPGAVSAMRFSESAGFRAEVGFRVGLGSLVDSGFTVSLGWV